MKIVCKDIRVCYKKLCLGFISKCLSQVHILYNPITDLDIFDDILIHGQLIIAEEVNMYKSCAISKSSQAFFITMAGLIHIVCLFLVQHLKSSMLTFKT